MNRYILLAVLILLVISAPADELSDKQKQLQKVQTQLQAAEKKAKETESKKKKADSNIQRTSSLKRRVDDNLVKLRKDERVKKDSFHRVSSQLTDVEYRLHSIEDMQNHSMKMLLRVDRSYAPTQIKHRDQRLLALMTEHNNMRLISMRGYRGSLVQERNLQESALSQVASQVRTQNAESQKMNKTLSSLQSESSKLAREQKQLQAQIAKLKKDASQLESLISRLTGSTPSTSSYQFTGKKIAWPVRGKILRSFGQETRAYGTSVTSNGIDIAVAEGTAVAAADDGEVVFADRFGGQGNLVIIDHKNGFFTVYAYNSSIVVGVGAKVKKGQTIARSGSTGSAMEPSLHFELRKDGKSINPIPYLE